MAPASGGSVRRIALAAVVAFLATLFLAVLYATQGTPRSTLAYDALMLAALYLVLVPVVVSSIRTFRRQQATVLRREQILSAATFAAESFLRHPQWYECMDDVLGRLGEAAAVSRVYVFENRLHQDGRLAMSNRFEWCAPGIASTIDDPSNQDFPYLPDFARWAQTLGGGDVIHGVVSSFPEPERRDAESEDVVSQAVVPIFAGAEWWGFLGFDDCVSARSWSSSELDALKVAASTLGAAIHRGRTERARHEAEVRYRTLVENIPAVTYIDELDDAGSTLYISPQVEPILGYTAREWMSDPRLWVKILHPEDRDRAVAANERHNETGEPYREEYRCVARNGEIVWIRDEAVVVRDVNGTARYSQGVLFDITEQKRAQEQVAFLAYHDKLTGLPNQAMFEELLRLAVSRAQRHALAAAVVWVDLDDFRLVNDSLGHRAGDQLIRELAVRLSEVTRETDLVARRGGDEFLLLLGDLERGTVGEVDAAVLTAQSVASRIQESLRVPFVLEGEEAFVSASIGISVCPVDAEDAVQMLQNAEAAMYDSKRTGPGGFVLSSTGAVESMTKLSFVTRLRRAVEGKYWELHYQPLVELATREMIGVEALIRWRDPSGELIPPGEFIPLAEELGLIGQITDWAVEELVRQDGAWRADGLELSELSFNLSARQFWQSDLVEGILSRLAAGDVDPQRVVVEITESSSMKDPERAQWILWELHNAGLRLAIDDFGTGYSSLWRLRTLPVDVLKIDRSFVSGVHRETEAASIVRAFIQLGRGLGKVTLAEGIETEEEWRFLTDMGCRLGQGYLFSKPVPAAEISARLARGELVVARDF